MLVSIYVNASRLLRIEIETVWTRQISLVTETHTKTRCIYLHEPTGKTPTRMERSIVGSASCIFPSALESQPSWKIGGVFGVYEVHCFRNVELSGFPRSPMFLRVDSTTVHKPIFRSKMISGVTELNPETSLCHMGNEWMRLQDEVYHQPRPPAALKKILKQDFLLQTFLMRLPILVPSLSASYSDIVTAMNRHYIFSRTTDCFSTPRSQRQHRSLS